MAVRIRLKKLGRKHRPFFRVCAMDSRAPRDGRVIEELGTYDPMVRETDARAILKGDRIDYWLSVGAQPTPKVAVLIKKYGTSGSHLDAQAKALEKLAGRKASAIADATAAAAKAAAAKPKEEPKPAEPEAAAEGDAGEAAPAEDAAETQEAAPETPAEENATESSDSEKTEE